MQSNSQIQIANEQPASNLQPLPNGFHMLPSALNQSLQVADTNPTASMEQPNHCHFLAPSDSPLAANDVARFDGVQEREVVASPSMINSTQGGGSIMTLDSPLVGFNSMMLPWGSHQPFDVSMFDYFQHQPDLWHEQEPQPRLG